MNDEFLTTPEAARFVRYSESTLKAWRKKNGRMGPPWRKMSRGLRGKVLYSRADLIRWVASRPIEEPEKDNPGQV